MLRYLRLLKLQFRTSALLASQYRWDFLVDGVLSLFWAATAVIPLFVVYGRQAQAGIPGWSLEESLVVTGWFILLQGILEGAISPGLQQVVEHIRKGTLDFLLLKPADAQFLVSTAKFHFWRITSFFTAGAVFTIAFTRMGRAPTVTGVLTAFLLMLAAIVVLYSLWILIISTAFYVVKVDNLSYLFTSIFDAARWPQAVFRGAVKFVFTFIIPIALMTTYPAEALLGRFDLTMVWAPWLGAALFAVAARAIWLRSLARYTSAGG